MGGLTPWALYDLLGSRETDTKRVSPPVCKVSEGYVNRRTLVVVVVPVAETGCDDVLAHKMDIRNDASGSHSNAHSRGNEGRTLERGSINFLDVMVFHSYAFLTLFCG